MQTDLRLEFHNQRLGDGEIVLTLEHDERSQPPLVGMDFSFRVTTAPVGESFEWSVLAYTGNYGYFPNLFAAEIRTLVTALRGTASLVHPDDFHELHLQVVDKEAGKIGVSGFVYTMSYGEFGGVVWPFNPAPNEGLKFLFSDLWVYADSLLSMPDQIDEFLRESRVYVGDDFWKGA